MVLLSEIFFCTCLFCFQKIAIIRIPSRNTSSLGQSFRYFGEVFVPIPERERGRKNEERRKVEREEKKNKIHKLPLLDVIIVLVSGRVLPSPHQPLDSIVGGHCCHYNWPLYISTVPLGRFYAFILYGKPQMCGLYLFSKATCRI